MIDWDGFRAAYDGMTYAGWNEVIALFAASGYVVRDRYAYPPDRGVLFMGAGA